MDGWILNYTSHAALLVTALPPCCCPVPAAQLTAGSPLALSTTKLSTTTSLQAVLSEPSNMAATAAVGLCTRVASDSQETLPGNMTAGQRDSAQGFGLGTC